MKHVGRAVAVLLLVLTVAGCASWDAGWEHDYMRRLSAAASVPREPQLATPRHYQIGAPDLLRPIAAVSLNQETRRRRFACTDGAALTLEFAADGASANAVWSDGAAANLRRVVRDEGVVFAGAGGELETTGDRAVWRGGGRTIVVAERDTLSRISERIYGTMANVQRIVDANPEITDPNRIEIGQTLRIPGAAADRRCRRAP